MVTRSLSLMVLVGLATAARAADPTPTLPVPVTTPVVPLATPPAPLATPPAPVATPPGVPSPPAPVVFHIPPATMMAGKSFELDARVQNETQLAALWVELQPAASALGHPAFDAFASTCRAAAGEYLSTTGTCTLVLRRTPQPEVFSAAVPGELVQPPGITYALFMRPTSGPTEPAFATREAPYPVLVTGESVASRRADRLERHRRHTAAVGLRSDVSFFGRARVAANPTESTPTPTRSEQFSDLYGAVELEYTARPLTTIYAFRLGVGVMRGQRATFKRGDGTRASVGSGPEPGLNYGFGEIDLELARTFYLTPRLTLGASEAGFSAGLGLEATIGRITSTHLALGVDWIFGLGAKGWLTFAWTTVPGFPMGLTVELTEHPSAATNTLGSRLLYDVGIELGNHFTLGLRVGYAQRATSFDGGFVVGLGGTYDF